MPSDVSETAVKALMSRLGEARRDAGLTLEQVADRSGVDLGVISRAERGQRIPALASILDLARALGVDLPEMLASVLTPPKGKVPRVLKAVKAAKAAKAAKKSGTGARKKAGGPGE